ncbi:leucine--tRNA ligase, putative [Plasmodium malariae]|uniref:leucine--tRNA ligase n=1 Tax=Plasmodium malariae TaxID=5858 RepID=A0A1C3KLI9_PLAMA|nr:leucine--tRNA ligase, putative [Plasmodium malariae]
MLFNLIFIIVVLYIIFYENNNNVYTLRIRTNKRRRYFFLQTCNFLKRKKGIKKLYSVKKKQYNFNSVEKKWQVIWNSKRLLDKDFEQYNKFAKRESTYTGIQENVVYDKVPDEICRQVDGEKGQQMDEKVCNENNSGSKRKYRMAKKFYILDMFPYPSSQGLHVGHILCFTITDVISKFKRMNNHCVFHPIGWDSFGLPCDRLSMKLKVDPRKIIKENISNFKKQLIRLGFLFNWNNEINTCEKTYFKWTQWIFIQMYLNKMAYKKWSYVNWSKEINCVISNDELKNELNLQNLKIEKVKLLQWYLKITKYANRLIRDLKLIDWPNKIKNMQINWISKKSGIILKAKIIPINKLIRSKILCKHPSKFVHVCYNSIYNHSLFLLFNCIYFYIIIEGRICEDVKVNYPFFSSILRPVNCESGLEIHEQERKMHGCIRRQAGGSGSHNTIFSPVNDDNCRREKPLHDGDALIDIRSDVHSDVSGVGDNASNNVFIDAYTEISACESSCNFLTYIEAKKGIYNLEEKGYYLKSFRINGNEVTNDDDIYVKIFLNENEAILENDKILVSVNHPNIKKIVNENKILLDFVNETVVQKDTERVKNDKIYFSGSVIYNSIINKFVPIYICSYILDNNRSILFLKKEQTVGDDKRRKVIYKLLLSSEYSKKKSIYNLKDWLFSRQRYWGEPFPVLYKMGKKNGKKEKVEGEVEGGTVSQAIEELVGEKKKREAERKTESKAKRETIEGGNTNCEKSDLVSGVNKEGGTCNEDFLSEEKRCSFKIGIKEVMNTPTKDIYIDKIPLCLPKFNKRIYEKDNNIKSVHSVLSRFKNWVVKRKKNILYKRESDVMPQWAGSSWYYLRYIDPKNKEKIVDEEKAKLWFPVDLYVGGSEHAVLHLLYARFFHKFLYDLKLVKHKEPFQKLYNQGILLNVTSFYLYTNLQNELVSYGEVAEQLEKRRRMTENYEINKSNNSLGGGQNCEKKNWAYSKESSKELRKFVLEKEIENGARNKAENGAYMKEAQDVLLHVKYEQSVLSSEKKEVNNKIDVQEKILKSDNYIVVEGIYKKYLIDEKYVKEERQRYYMKDFPSIEVQPNFEKMSKSKGNTINPMDIIKEYGSDCLRLHVLFLGPLDQDKRWSIKGIKGTFKFLTNLYNLFIQSNEKRAHEIDKKGKHGEEEHLYGKDYREREENPKDVADKTGTTIKCEDIICQNCKNRKKNKKLVINFEDSTGGDRSERRSTCEGMAQRVTSSERGDKLKKYFELLRDESQIFKKLSNKIKKRKVDEIENEKKERANYYIERITNCISTIKLNTAVSFFMKFFNEIKTWDYIPLKIFLTFIKLLYPFCPHICEEFWYYYLIKYKKKKRKKICYFCNSSLLYYAKWPSLFQIKEENKFVNVSIKINNKHIAIIQNNPQNAQNIISVATNMIKDRIQNEIKKGKKIFNIINIPNKVINFIIK